MATSRTLASATSGLLLCILVFSAPPVSAEPVDQPQAAQTQDRPAQSEPSTSGRADNLQASPSTAGTSALEVDAPRPLVATTPSGIEVASPQTSATAGASDVSPAAEAIQVAPVPTVASVPGATVGSSAPTQVVNPEALPTGAAATPTNSVSNPKLIVRAKSAKVESVVPIDPEVQYLYLGGTNIYSKLDPNSRFVTPVNKWSLSTPDPKTTTSTLSVPGINGIGYGPKVSFEDPWIVYTNTTGDDVLVIGRASAGVTSTGLANAAITSFGLVRPGQLVKIYPCGIFDNKCVVSFQKPIGPNDTVNVDTAISIDGTNVRYQNDYSYTVALNGGATPPTTSPPTSAAPVTTTTSRPTVSATSSRTPTPSAKPKPPINNNAVQAASAVQQFLDDLDRGVSLADLTNDVSTILNKGKSVAAPELEKALSRAGLGVAAYQIANGIASHDSGQVLAGSLSLLAAASKPVPPLAAAITAASLAGQFFAPLTNQQQIDFLNKYQMCHFHTTTDLTPKQAQQVVDRYAGFVGVWNMVRDYTITQFGGCP